MKPPAILYHYCSNVAFQKILEQRKVRLSLLSMSNDAKEGRHVIDLATRLLPADFRHKDQALQQLTTVISIVSAVGFCLSEAEDVLSQWRGYADNAQGVAVGLDSRLLQEIAEQEQDDQVIVRLVPVAYDDRLLAAVMKPDLDPIVDHYQSGKMNMPLVGTILSPMTDEERTQEEQRYLQATSELFHMLFRIANYAYMVKPPFFKEEREWRVKALLTNIDGTLGLSKCEFEAGSDKLKPFRCFPLKGFPVETIREVVLGPRNRTPNEVVRLFLNSNGFGHTIVRPSIGGSYR